MVDIHHPHIYIYVYIHVLWTGNRSRIPPPTGASQLLIAARPYWLPIAAIHRPRCIGRSVHVYVYIYMWYIICDIPYHWMMLSSHPQESRRATGSPDLIGRLTQAVTFGGGGGLEQRVPLPHRKRVPLRPLTLEFSNKNSAKKSGLTKNGAWTSTNGGWTSKNWNSTWFNYQKKVF